MNERFRMIRKKVGLSQEVFGEQINLSRSHIASLENGSRNLTDRIISDVCREFHVNENWLRDGQAPMFVQPDEFSLDEYAKNNNLTGLELDIIKGYMDLDSDIRKEIISHFKSIFDKHSEIAVTKEDLIDEEVESYRLELEAELKGATSSVSEDIKDIEDLEGRTS